MAWTTPMTAVAGAFSAAQWNTYVRDNLNMTEAAVATSGTSQWFVSTAANTIGIRNISSNSVLTEELTTSTSFTNLTTSGPSVTITTGTKAIVMVSCRSGNMTASQYCKMSYAVSGATTIAATENWGAITSNPFAALTGDNLRSTGVANLVTLTAGSNTFTAKYSVTAGTGRFACRYLAVWSF